MAYVLAAYSITIGVLSIYGVLLQHRARVARVRALRGAGRTGVSTADLGRGFNLGASLLAPFWAWSHGLRAAGVTLLVTGGAFILAQASGLRWPALALSSILIGAALFFGVAGNRIAAARAGSADPVAFLDGQLPWAVAGATLYTIVLPWACYFWRGAA